jgi:2-oxoglutarate dehydrogenase E1 component
VLGEELTMLSPNVVPSRAYLEGRNALEVIQHLRELYCGTIGYDFTHVQSAEERTWLTDAVESHQFERVLQPGDKKALLQRLIQVELLERYLQENYAGKTRFSIEGVDVLVPMLDELAGCAADAGTTEVLIGMAHRGRINVLAHVLGRPYAAIFAEFNAVAQSDRANLGISHLGGWTGDVKYHAGALRVYNGDAVVQMSIALAPNPRHLEFVNPVVEGRTRAAQEQRTESGPPVQDDQRALPILLHGDASFPGQGIVAETLNLSRLAGYRTGGTIHIIVNNQIGFTTDPADGRSTLYASDLAKGFEIPIIHVNADDVEACLAAVRLAYAYRLEFRKDVLIDLIGYRRLGHNEGDEPAFTQPKTYDLIAKHPTVREVWAATLASQGIVTPADERTLLTQARAVLDAANAASAQQSDDLIAEETKVGPESAVRYVAPSALEIQRLNAQTTDLPASFTLHRNLARVIQRRREVSQTDGLVDWGHAETLALASVLADGIPVRLSGQDSERGTFSHRHAVLHDTVTGNTFIPLQNFPLARASFAVHNSPLSEAAVVGFEYGYSIQAPHVLVLWEAQYGDFINSAQVMVDEFVASGYAKWRQTPSLVLLLPHGYEGQGPDHSSARIERFLRLCSSDNIRVANCTTASQYFHLLRHQASLLEQSPRPLVIFTPKSLLRHRRAQSRLSELSSGHFLPVLDDERARPVAAEVTRVVLCSGKVFVDLIDYAEKHQVRSVAVVRVEQLYPIPQEALHATVASYPQCREVVWAQEEPRNMGAWPYLGPRIRDLLGGQLPVRYAGRPERGSPAEGAPEVHVIEQERLIEEAFASIPALVREKEGVIYAR